MNRKRWISVVLGLALCVPLGGCWFAAGAAAGGAAGYAIGHEQGEEEAEGSDHHDHE